MFHRKPTPFYYPQYHHVFPNTQTMNDCQKMLREFHEKFGAAINNSPSLSPKDDKLRVELIREELSELEESLKGGNLVEVADALGDLLYVVYGAAVTYGIDMEPVFAEIHRSNMSKLWTDQEVMAATGDELDGGLVEHDGVTYKFVGGVAPRYWVAKRGDGKALKSPSYSPASLYQFICKSPEERAILESWESYNTLNT